MLKYNLTSLENFFAVFIKGDFLYPIDNDPVIQLLIIY